MTQPADSRPAPRLVTSHYPVHPPPDTQTAKAATGSVIIYPQLTYECARAGSQAGPRNVISLAQAAGSRRSSRTSPCYLDKHVLPRSRSRAGLGTHADWAEPEDAADEEQRAAEGTDAEAHPLVLAHETLQRMHLSRGGGATSEPCVVHQAQCVKASRTFSPASSMIPE